MITRFIRWLFRPRTCKARGCGYEIVGNDDKCVLCRLPITNEKPVPVLYSDDFEERVEAELARQGRQRAVK